MADNKTKFQFNWNVGLMGRDAESIARENGLSGRDNLDSFRHGYVSAKTSEKLGDVGAYLFGIANEIHGIGQDTSEDHFVDLRNNAIGLRLLDEAEQEAARQQAERGLSEDETRVLKEQLLQAKITDAVNAGQLLQHPFESGGVSIGKDVTKHPYDKTKK